MPSIMSLLHQYTTNMKVSASVSSKGKLMRNCLGIKHLTSW